MILQNKKAVVTGGGHGIGKEIAKSFLANGAQVLVISRSQSELEGAEVMAADVSNPDDVRAIVNWVKSKWGVVDILVNAAGILGPVGSVLEISPEEWQKTIDINLTGTFLMVRALAPLMKKGKIINFVGGGDGARPNFSAYVASKGGIARFTETVAAELKDRGIDVNAIAPGAVNTKMLEDVLKAGQRAGPEYQQALRQKEEGGVSPEKAANLALFLASNKSDGLSGKILSAVWDNYEKIPEHLAEIQSSDIYNFRRIKPQERGKDWH